MSAVDLASLRCALLVRDAGSFRRAATTLGVRTSVVSRKIRALEDTIGVSLFQRQSQGVQPTWAGTRVLRHAAAILAEVNALTRAATLSGSGAEGQLCLGVIASIAGGRTRELLVDFVSAHPGVEIDVVEGSPGDHVNAVRALRMDIALVADSPAAAGCNVEPLWSERIFVALPVSSPLIAASSLRWDQLGELRFLVSKSNAGAEMHDMVMRHLAEFGRTPVIEPRAVQRGGLLGLVSLGVGISLVSTAEATVIYPGVVFRPLEGELLPFSAVWADNNDNPVLRRFLALARAQVRRVQ